MAMTGERETRPVVAERPVGDTAELMLTHRQAVAATWLIVGSAAVYAAFVLGSTGVVGWHWDWYDHAAVVLGLMLAVYLVAMGTRLVQVVSAKRHQAAPPHREVELAERADWPTYTVLVPLFHEGNVVAKLIRNLGRLDYPADRLQIMLLLEEDDDETINVVNGLLASGKLPAHFDRVFVPVSQPRTKPKALNHGLTHAWGEYLVIYDAEDEPEPDQLKKAVLALEADDGVACVQARLEYWNSQENLLTRWFAAEYAMHFFLLLPGLSRRGWPVPLGGTSNHFRADTIRGLGGWDAYNVTEDADLGLRIARQGLRVGIIDSVTAEEANSRPRNWVRQRSRWIKGYIQTWLVHMRSPVQLWRELGTANFLAFQAIVGGSWFTPLINPIFWALSVTYLVTQSVAIERMFPPVIFYPGIALLIVGNFINVCTFVMGVFEREDQEGNVKVMLLLPVYFVMMSVAAYKAAGQLINPARRHYWEKTEHGLSEEMA